MKILIVAPDFRPNTGGIAAYAYALAFNLSERGHDVSVLAPPAGAQGSRKDGFLVFRPHWMSAVDSQGGFRGLVKMLQLMRGIQQFIRREESFDKILMTNLNYGIAMGLANMKKLYSVILHGNETLYILGQKGIIKQLVMTRMFRYAVGSAQFIFTNSHYSADIINKVLEESREIGILYCGVDIDLLEKGCQKSVARQELNLEQRPTLLSVGRLVKRKGYDTVLKAIKLLVKDFPTIYYVIVGVGPFGKELQEMVRTLRIEEHVHFAGLLTAPEIVGKYYSACDVFVLISRNTAINVETFGIVYLEANAYGKPVVAGNSGGVSDAVKDGVNGFLVDSEDHIAVAERIVHLLNDQSLCEKMAQAGRRRIAEQFNWPAITTCLENFWDRGSIGN
ncbi:MAG: glycosyltransferase family 4 protein [Planctomycetota bacterium]|jgi:phosphatidylinositol alpha-1,6-mannosyltransferase